MTHAPSTPRARSLRAPAHVRGVTLFTGVQSEIIILPAAAGSGISFRIKNAPGQPVIPAHVSRVVPESRRTVLSADPSHRSAPSVQTTEHLLSALAGLGITDALIDLVGPEIPMGDGSALPFVEAVLAVGIDDLGPVSLTARPPAHVVETIVIEDRSGRIEAHPLAPGDTPGLYLEYRLDYPPGAGIPSQAASLLVPYANPPMDYAKEIAPARTFSLLQEAQMAQAAGLFKHLTPRDTLVIGPQGPIDNSYRFPNEPARHKLLDMLGDLALAARPISARVIGIRSGHALNHQLAASLARLP